MALRRKVDRRNRHDTRNPGHVKKVGDMAIPGDIVTHDGEQRVVVDVSGEGWAVLRAPHDLAGNDPTAAEASTLAVVGHVESVPGWVEDAPGQWRQA